MEKINSLNEQITKISKEINILTMDLEDVEAEISFIEKSRDGKLAEKEAKFIEEKTREVDEASEKLAEPYIKKIAQLKNKLDTKEVDESPELAEERKALEYLNTASKDIADYLGELQKSVTPPFIDNGFVTIGYTAKQFRSAYKSLPKRVTNLREIRNKSIPPYSLFTSKEEVKNGTVTFYKTVAYHWFRIIINFPELVTFSVKRARYIHACCIVYHKLMMSMTELRFATTNEINRLFNELIQLRNEKLLGDIEELESKLTELEVERDNQVSAIVFDKEAEIKRVDNTISGLKADKIKDSQKLSELKDQKEELFSKLEEAEEEYENRLLDEREYYLEDNDDRSVVLPRLLLLNYSKSGNVLFEFKAGFYVYEDLDTVNNFIRLCTFQVRNIMEWGSVQFRVFDLLGGDSVSRLALPPDDKSSTQDIFIYSLSEERTDAITLMHDLLIRRVPQISRISDNLGDFNLVQKENNSPPQSYQLLFFIYTDAIKPTEKLIQLMYTGLRVGIYVFIFHKNSLTDLPVVKVMSDYIADFIEITDTGLTSYTAKDFLAIKEAEELVKRKSI